MRRGAGRGASSLSWCRSSRRYRARRLIPSIFAAAIRLPLTWRSAGRAATGYALTSGIHSRIDETVNHVLSRLGIGNSYVNRNMIGAVVGAQPFGGERLSGTGPKAGGPRYLHRFATERTVSIDTTAAGGNASLLALGES